MQIGLDVSTSAADGADPVTDAEIAEKWGYNFVSAPITVEITRRWRR
jgi:hypothetical protein